MYVAKVCGCTSILSNRCEVYGDLFSRVEAKLFEEFNVLRVQVLAVLLKEPLLLRQEGDVSELCKHDKGQFFWSFGALNIPAAFLTYW